MPIKLIVGLQNPGATYADTRHNAGGWFVSSLAACSNSVFKTNKKLHSQIATLDSDLNNCKLMLPLTFMNLSGLPVKAVSQFYQIKEDEILIVHDDLDIDTGFAKIKTSGGHGGHNGIRDIITHLKTTNFHRLRIGIGHPGHKDLVLNYVLGKPSAQDKKLISKAIENGISIISTIIKEEISVAMNILNK